MKKIGIIGVHGAGKTTLAYLLAAHYKTMGVNVKLIHESARENCPFPLNADANQGTCLWNFHKQFLNELEAEAQGYELSICDRSVLDTFIYFHAVNQENSITHYAMLQAAHWLSTYDLLVCMEPDEEADVADDGIRETDLEYQNLIKGGFREALHKHNAEIADKIYYTNCGDVFDQERCCHLIANLEQTLENSCLKNRSRVR